MAMNGATTSHTGRDDPMRRLDAVLAEAAGRLRRGCLEQARSVGGRRNGRSGACGVSQRSGARARGKVSLFLQSLLILIVVVVVLLLSSLSSPSTPSRWKSLGTWCCSREPPDPVAQTSQLDVADSLLVLLDFVLLFRRRCRRL